MAICMDVQSDQLNQKAKLGGRRASLFVYVLASLENMGFIANAVSLVTYFYGDMHFNLPKSANTLTNWLGTTFLLSFFGGFISDTYLSRFKTSVLFGCLEVMGLALLTVGAHFQQLRPLPCKDPADLLRNQCPQANTAQNAILYVGLYLMAFGNGGVKAALPALGADQFDERDPIEVPKLASYFNWLLFSITFGAMFGVTFLVWISANRGWDWSFGVCTIAVVVGILVLCMGNSIYRNNVPQGSPYVRIAQVFVAAFRNRNLTLPEMADELHEIHNREAGKDIEILNRTNQFKFLDKAAIVRGGNESMGPWRTCTVTQVEEIKILLRMLPVILSTVFMNTCLAQLQTFSIQQGATMDRTIRGFEIPSSSLIFLPLFFMTVAIPIYEHMFIPITRKFTGIPTGIRQLQRVGVGLVLSIISMAAAGFVETRRKSVAIEHGMIDSNAPVPMTVFWLGIQYSIFGIADMFTLAGLLDFFYAESSSGMKSLGTAISWSSMALGYYTSSVVVDVVNKVSGGWLASNNLNRDHLNYFYWLLAVLSIVNFVFYLMCSSWYKYKKVEMKQLDAKPSEEKVYDAW